MMVYDEYTKRWIAEARILDLINVLFRMGVISKGAGTFVAVNVSNHRLVNRITIGEN